MILTIILVLLGIALVAVFINREKDEDKARLAIVGLTVAIIAVAFINLSGIGDSGPTADTSTDRAIGQVAADRVGQAAQGQRVVIVADLNPNNPYARDRVEAFRQHLSTTYGKQVMGVQNPWPEDPTVGQFPEEGMNAWGIEQALQNYPDAEVIVSLAGLPIQGMDGVIQQLRSLEFFALDESFSMDWEPYLRQGILNGVIAPPIDANWTDTSGEPEAIFERRYVFVTTENLSAVSHRFEDPYLADWD